MIFRKTALFEGRIKNAQLSKVSPSFIAYGNYSLKDVCATNDLYILQQFRAYRDELRRRRNKV